MFGRKDARQVPGKNSTISQRMTVDAGTILYYIVTLHIKK